MLASSDSEGPAGVPLFKNRGNRGKEIFFQAAPNLTSVDIDKIRYR